MFVGCFDVARFMCLLYCVSCIVTLLVWFVFVGCLFLLLICLSYAVVCFGDVFVCELRFWCGVVYIVAWFDVDSGGFCLLIYIWWLFWLCFDDCVTSVDCLCGLLRDVVFWWLIVLVFVAWMFGVYFLGWLFPIDDLSVVDFVSARFGLGCDWLLIV